MNLIHDTETLEEVFDILESIGAAPSKREDFIKAAASKKPLQVKVGTTQVGIALGEDSWSVGFVGKAFNPHHAGVIEALNERLDVAYRKFN